jgi:hypothetical protein
MPERGFELGAGLSEAEEGVADTATVFAPVT